MRLPRRVPWSTLAELDQVCSWIYSDETDIDARVKAINRLSAWRAIAPLPHALEAAQSLLAPVILDEQLAVELQHAQLSNDGQSNTPRAKNSSGLTLRQSYAAAIVRLVNGLVDPLQLGTYARSIASIAAQIGLPQWLVELRHAATHEHLPSLEVLRIGAKESLAWLLHNYFIPTLSASDIMIYQSAPTVNLPPLVPLLKRYKSLMKTISRDASLRTKYKDDLAKVLRDIERWVGEAKVVSSVAMFDAWGACETGDGEEEKERWALERLCDALLERGGLVPVSSKKRLATNLKSPPVLPSSLISVWSPLLSALNANHSSLPSVLVSAITELLIRGPSTPSGDDSSKRDLSYELCLSAWAAWCVDQCEMTALDVQMENSSVLKRRDVVIGLVSALGIRADESVGPRKGGNALLSLLVRAYPELEETTTSLLSVTQHAVPMSSKDAWTDAELQVMEDRLKMLLSSPSPTTAGDAHDSLVMMEIDKEVLSNHNASPKLQVGDMPRGWSEWSSAPLESWKACAIGCFVPSTIF